MSKPESEIIKQVSYGQADFTLLYRQYATRIYRYIFARVSNHADAEDLTAQVFMEALQGLDRFDDSGNFSAWLFTIARNKVVDSYRRRKQLLSIEDAPEIIAENSEPLTRVVHSETIQQLSTVLKTLKPEQRELLQLRFAGELTYAQIAAVLGKTEAATKMSIHRLLRQLQGQMEQSNE
jgi:RNA polymerase sigma-70 factor (ECF subfamily)